MTVVPLQSFFPFLKRIPLKAIQEGYTGLAKLIAFSQSSVRSFTKSVELDPNFAKGTFLRNLVVAVDAETGSRLDPEELVENTIIFLVAGSDTTAVTTIYTLWEIGRNEKIRVKLVKEIRDAFPDPKVSPTYETASNLVS